MKTKLPVCRSYSIAQDKKTEWLILQLQGNKFIEIFRGPTKASALLLIETYRSTTSMKYRLVREDFKSSIKRTYFFEN